MTAGMRQAMYDEVRLFFESIVREDQSVIRFVDSQKYADTFGFQWKKYALTQMDNLWVTANFKETQLARMRPGQSVVIHIDALGRDYHGRVENMPGATGSLYDLLPPENATGNYVKIVQRLPVRIRFDHGQDLSLLRPGMSVEPKVWLR